MARRSESAWLYVIPPSHYFRHKESLLTCQQVIRGNSVVMLEALERIGGDDRRGDR